MYHTLHIDSEPTCCEAKRFGIRRKDIEVYLLKEASRTLAKCKRGHLKTTRAHQHQRLRRVTSAIANKSEAPTRLEPKSKMADRRGGAVAVVPVEEAAFCLPASRRCC